MFFRYSLQHIRVLQLNPTIYNLTNCLVHLPISFFFDVGPNHLFMMIMMTMRV